jgi:hypothetical protein
MSPLEDLAVGKSCGEVGWPPRGRDAESVLEKQRRVDLFRNVLRGPNPEGRVYAAQALTDLQAMRPEDGAVVAKLASLPIPIMTCGGCTYWHQSSAAALRYRN